jgi:hypothetical protein
MALLQNLVPQDKCLSQYLTISRRKKEGEERRKKRKEERRKKRKEERRKRRKEDKIEERRIGYCH